MAVQFILGRSGTGKTSYCIKAIADSLLEPADNQQLILLVPEQATYQAERAILADKRIGGYGSGGPFCKRDAKCGPALNVLSFDRLQFLLLGRHTARPGLSRIGQQMIIQRILRENVSKLKLFGTSAGWAGLGRQMAETISELQQYGKDAGDVEQLLVQLQKDERNSLAALKFGDISLVFKEYLKLVEGRFIDPDIQLTRACGAVSTAVFLQGARLWVDGFAGFTTAEFAMLAELLKVVVDAQIAICLEPSRIDTLDARKAGGTRIGLFSPTEQTYAALIEIIKKCKLQLAKPIVLNKAVRFSSCRQLAHIEREIFSAAPVKMRAEGNVHIISAPSARAEVQFTARQILELVKEKGYRYRDIAVIASDIERYQHYVRAYFEDYGIPFFIDRRKSLKQHPVVELICSALQAVSSGFSGRDIFAYLKTDLVPIGHCPVPMQDNRRGIDLLENYCLAFGVGGGDWTSGKQWAFAGDDGDFDEQRVNEIRVKVVGPLLKLRDRLYDGEDAAGEITSREFTQIIFDFLEGLGVRKRIGEWIKEAVENGDYAAADEHRQFYSKFVDIFDELVEVFGGCRMSCEDYVAIVNCAFSQMRLALIPPGLDQILVGSIERSRHPDLKAVFLIGATQRRFPVPLSCGGVLTDDDRGAAEEVDFALAATSSQKLLERQYLAYIAFTRPSELLCVTYPSVDDKGGAVPRSQFVASLESVFENLREESIAAGQVPIDKIHSAGELTDLLCSQLGESQTANGESSAGELLDDVCADAQLAELGRQVVSAINYDNRAQLDKGTVEQLCGGRVIRSSATRLSSFAACPYQYFARYILELQERKEAKLRPLDVGDFYHRVLDALLKRLNEEKKDFATVRKEDLLELLGEETSKIVQTSSFISNFVRHCRHNAFIINSAVEVLEDCVLAIAQMVRAGEFRPSLSEVSFGKVRDSDCSLGEYKIGLSDGRELFLDGKIDRIDIAEFDGEKAAIVFDYKSKGQSFSWSKFYYGLDMQLAIYMLAVRDANRSTTKNAAGAFYMPVETKIQPAALDELSEKAGRFGYKASGLFNGEFFRRLDLKASKDSKFYNFYVTKDEQPYGNYGKSGALKPNDFGKVLEFAEKKVAESVEEALSGKIDILPYRLSGKSPCSYCRYKSVCRFDWQINRYNYLQSIGKKEVLEEIGTVDG